MSAPVATKTLGIIKALVIAVVVIAIVVGGALIVADLTPNKLGLGSIAISGTPLNQIDMGDGTTMADIKIKDIFSAIKSLTADSNDLEKSYQNEDKISTDTSKVDEALKGTNVSTSGDKVDYTTILDNKVIYPEEKEIQYTSQDLGTIMSSLLDSAMSQVAKVQPDTMVLLSNKPLFINAGGDTIVGSQQNTSTPQLNVSLVSFGIVSENGDSFLRFVVKIDLANVIDQLTEVMPSQIMNLLGGKIPTAVFIEVKNNLVISNNQLSAGNNTTILINNNTALTSLAFNLAGNEINPIKDQAVELVVGTFCKLVNNLGKVQSIDNGKIILKTYTALDK